MEFNVNDYVRTKQKGFQPPQIAKIKSMKRDVGYNNQYYIELDHNLLPDYNFYIYEEDIEKASPKIINLIKKGDYVNGLYIHGISDFGLNVYIYGDVPETLEEQDIESILTKEQFSSMRYEVEQDE